MEIMPDYILPKAPEDCSYSEYWYMTNKYECTLRSGMFCRCTLEAYGKCILEEKKGKVNKNAENQ